MLTNLVACVTSLLVTNTFEAKPEFPPTRHDEYKLVWKTVDRIDKLVFCWDGKEHEEYHKVWLCTGVSLHRKVNHHWELMPLDSTLRTNILGSIKVIDAQPDPFQGHP